MKKNKIDVIFGHGKITEPGKVEVTSSGKTQTYKSTHIILATGARIYRVLPNILQDGTSY